MFQTENRNISSVSKSLSLNSHTNTHTHTDTYKHLHVQTIWMEWEGMEPILASMRSDMVWFGWAESVNGIINVEIRKNI